jgi:PAS domain S-box-containing protein
MVVDPWGEVLAQREEGAGVVLADARRARAGAGAPPAAGARAPRAVSAVPAARACRRRAAVAWRRWSLWGLLGVLVVRCWSRWSGWPARYEASQAQSNVERDAADALSDIRSALTRNVQTCRRCSPGIRAASMAARREQLLREHREWVRIEWRDPRWRCWPSRHAVPPPVFARFGRASSLPKCSWPAPAARAQRPGLRAQPLRAAADGLGLELMELCLPQVSAGQLTGYVVATYSLASCWPRWSAAAGAQPGDVLHRGRRHAAGDARLGAARQPRVHRAAAAGPARQHHGAAHGQLARAPDLFPNVLTALVTAMSIALVTVLVMLGKDMRRRLRAEHDLADALAFRKAMEDSLVTGLRARDLQGRITYVNPAFCAMVGFEPEELLGHATPGARTGRRSWRTNTRSGRRSGCRASTPAARRLRVGVHAQGRLALPGADHRGALINALGRADRLDERVPGHQRAAAGSRSSRAPARSGCRRPRGWPRGRDGLAPEPRAEPAAGRDRQLRHRLDEPAAARRRAAPTCSWRCAASPSRPSAPAA